MQQPLHTHLSNSAYRAFDLVQARYNPSNLQPAAHQQAALGALHTWFGNQSISQHGGIVVLPTGGGKTFTAVRFLCREPLSQNYKVLWLAHTHHLLDQANSAFASLDPAQQQKNGLEVGLIAAPKSWLNVRVVSGTAGHCPPSTIAATDDVVIATLQTMTGAVENLSSLAGLKAWLQSAKDLVVVFDEAHHAAAPSYRKLLATLCQSHPQFLLLGLTATPTHADQSKNGWLGKLFPQGILHQVSAKRLMIDGVLAWPIVETCTTEIVPEWDKGEFQRWLGSHRDLPEGIVSDLAKNRERNALIANTYATNREKYGKTIIFAERWYQCEQIRELLQQRSVRAGVVYSHIGAAADEDGPRRDKGANERELEAFRSGDLDVLLNVRMLTEGTDVPGVQSVFLTRQTTSEILLTQMVGRALRGPRFGGTDTAYIVSFQDNWQYVIPWANLTLPSGGAETGMDDITEDVGEGETDLTDEAEEASSPSEDSPSATRPRPPLQLMSIDIVRQLARATDSGQNVAPGEFTSLIPVGWYATTFETLVRPATEDDGGDDDFEGDTIEDAIETVRDIVLVYNRDKASYEDFVAHLQTQSLDEFASEGVTLDAVRSTVEEWQTQFFACDVAGTQAAETKEERLRHLLDIARHMAQRVGSGTDVVPPYLDFEQRQSMDLDAIARDYIQQGLSARATMTALRQEFERSDRLWQVIYPNFVAFMSQYDACEIRLLMGELPAPEAGTIRQPEQVANPEVGEPEVGEPEVGDEL